MISHLSRILEKPLRADPQKTAVIDRDQSLSYQALESQSNQIANCLTAQGVGRGDRVAIFLPKSLAMVVAVVGVLKVGAAYVPIPESAPPKRATWLINDCAVKAVITTQQKLAGLDQQELPVATRVILIDGANPGPENLLPVADWGVIQNQPLEFSLPGDPNPEDMAYILYTSGSTGNPKGVMISHRAALNFVNWAAACFDVCSTDRVANHAPLQFDLSVFDIFASLKEGATLVLVPKSLALFPVSLARFIAEQKISVWYSVPSALVQLVLYGKLDTFDFANLRTVLFAGEVFPLQYLQNLMTQWPAASFHNLYGPTETNVCTYYSLTASPSETLPIGVPCADHEIRISDVGELLVAGPSLMHGYWNLPQVSDVCFVEIDTVQYYRTGDRVALRPDGNLAYLGRLDNMVKSRGYRIEPGEIEAVLYEHPAVIEAAVVPIPHAEFGAILRAVVALQKGVELPREKIIQFCKQRLPDYMVPSEILIETALPKTATGKIDKKKLLIGA